MGLKLVIEGWDLGFRFDGKSKADNHILSIASREKETIDGIVRNIIQEKQILF